MINKNFYRKTNDKKILHKVGKQWKVVSVALLMAIGGAAVATHVNANAASTNDQNNAQTNSLVSFLNQSGAANAPQFATKAPVQKQASAQPSAASIYYYPGSNGSAASYFDKAANESGTANKYYDTVNTYVQSLDNEYGPQVSSFATKSVSASAAAKKDSKLANSYSAVAKNPNTTNTIISLASKSNVNPNLYVGMVQDNEQAYSNAVSSASNDVKANSDVASLTDKLENTDFSAASLSASTASVVAESNFTGAQNVYSSVYARYYGNDRNNAGFYLNIASELSAGATTLLAEGNPAGYNSQLEMLLNDNALDGNERDNAQSAVNSAITTAVNSAKADFKAVSANPTTFSEYAEGQFDTLLSDGNYGVISNNAIDANNTAESSEYQAAVSAATDEQFSTTLASAANSLYGYYNPRFADYNTFNANRKSAVASASAEVRATSYANEFAHANNYIVDVLSGEVKGYHGAASLASHLLNEGVSKFEANLGMTYSIQNPWTLSSNNATITSNYVTALIGTLGNNDQTLLKDMPISNVYNTNMTRSDLASALTKAAANLKRDVYLDNNTVKVNNNDSLYTDNAFSDALKQVNPALSSDNSNSGQKYAAIDKMVDALNDAAANVYQTSDGLHSQYVFNGYTTKQTVPAYEFDTAALLSDGVDMKKLEAESGAIANVSGAVASAAKSDGFANESGDEQFGNELSVAASSADSALNSAQSVSGNYSEANDENVTLSSYFASSYTTDASNEANSSTNASSGLNTFFKSMAADDTFNSADDAYNDAKAAEDNDYKLGAANAKAIYNRSAHFLDVLKGASLHTTPNFGSKNDKVVAHANKGDRLTVYGVNVSRNNMKRGVVRYFVLDNTTGKKGFITGQPNYTKAAYLSAVAEHQNVQVKTLKPVRVYSDLASKKAVGTIPAGKVLDNADIVYGDATEDAHGFTKVETASYDFLTANTDYVAIIVPTVQNNTNNTNNDNFNYNLQNNNLDFDKYYNDTTED